ncbi:hypothetical protein K491DRAFT_447268 [Lophiostoma macrostomum CBS 122681]|uniref:Uncharacterized protein n=1 Tax=Lophiostoma macrostomum CBS 122681 TaxID=1314788 RepID=A0A6A6TND3_9PLEO|nr:hypothetical protein K491DRAFT_447268 [Lophiostoma macrostomum CBS 122681]
MDNFLQSAPSLFIDPSEDLFNELSSTEFFDFDGFLCTKYFGKINQPLFPDQRLSQIPDIATPSPYEEISQASDGDTRLTIRASPALYWGSIDPSAISSTAISPSAISSIAISPSVISPSTPTWTPVTSSDEPSIVEYLASQSLHSDRWCACCNKPYDT